MVIIGVDGGGTKTEAVAVDERGRILGRGLGGPSNIAESEERVVVESIKQALSPLRGFINDKTVLVMGMASVGEIRGVEKFYGEIAFEALGLFPDIVVNDVVLGWAAGTLGEDGIHVVSGTGSIAYGRFKGKEMRCGGWGSVIGDEGSAYDIGVRALQAVSMQLDGRMKESMLKKIVFSEMAFKDHYDFIEWIYSKEGDRRERIASVAKIVHKAALEGDGTARSILQEAGKALAGLVIAIYKGLGMRETIITYSGSVLEKNEIVREAFENAVRERLKVKGVNPSRFPPVFGAIVLGFSHLGWPLPDDLFSC